MLAIQPNEIGHWFEKEAAALVLYARRWFNQAEAEAEEVVQEAFVRLMQQHRRPRHVRGWLYTTVRNTCKTGRFRRPVPLHDRKGDIACLTGRNLLWVGE